ncbi:hypothetical protein [Microlunatus speluncae]|uniref:hypothetical protein n=1 Tax=Microlunatus speluncae TaxID=2594267 RepID=UPI0012665312|nr:hypothetical protein [Microlunatus speluncae]
MVTAAGHELIMVTPREPVPGHGPVLRTMIIIAAVTLLLAGCVSTRPPRPTDPVPVPASSEPAPAPVPTPYAGPGKPPLELTELWQNDDQPLAEIDSAEVIAGSLVITGWEKTRNDQESVVIDADHGKVRWRAGQLPREFRLDSADRPTARLSQRAGWAVERLADGMLILPYHLGSCRDGGHECPAKELKPYREHGLVGFSLADRRQVWHTAPVRGAAPRTDRPQTSGFQKFEVVGATSSTVLVTLGVAGNYLADLEWESPDRQPQTIAYDSAMGWVRWRIEGFAAETVIDGDVVIGLERSSRPGAAGGVPVGVDAVLGSRLWSMPDSTSVRWSSIGGFGLIVADVGDAGRGPAPARRTWISGPSGHTHPLPPVSPAGADWIAPRLGGPLAWRVVPASGAGGASGGPQLQTLDDDGEVTIGPTALPDDAVAAEVGLIDYVWVSQASGRVRGYDQTGTPRTKELTGSVRVVAYSQLLISHSGSTRLQLLDLD